MRDGGLGYDPPALDRLHGGGLYLLRGPRRVGKTVTVKHKIGDLLREGVPPTAIVRVAADGWSAKDIRTVVQNVALPPVPTGTIRWWFLDEVTAATGPWAQQVKWLRDNDPTFAGATVALTGSDAASLTEAAGLLAGRRGVAGNVDRTLLPMGFRTFARLLQPALPDGFRVGFSELRSRGAADAYQQLLVWLDELVVLWERYLVYGGFPSAVAAARAGEPVPQGFVDDLFNVVARDTFGASKLSVTTTMSLLDRLWSAMGAPANLSKIGRDVGVSDDVVARHVAYLRDAFLLWHCPQRAPGTWTPRHRAQDKLYAVDPLVARLPSLRNPSRTDVDTTLLTEMQVGMAVQRAAYAAGWSWADDQFLFHARTPARKEIDFVSRLFTGTAIEGKYVEGGHWASDAATVNASEWDGLLTTRNVLDVSGPQAWAVPACILAYTLDT